MNTIAELWRYPIKSFQGERVESIELGPNGSPGDRVFAVVDPAARKVLSAKRYADLLMASARTVDGSIVLTLPTGDEFAAEDDKVHAALSDWLGKDVRLETPPTDGVFPMEMYSGMSDESTPLFDWPGPPGTWLDLADAHFLTTASLGDWDVRRFRPTALIESSETEEGWDTVSLGSVEAKVIMPTPRCSMPSRAQPGLERDMSVGTTIRDTRGNNLGVYCSITKAGTLNVGDPVTARTQ
jgi:MOSC domain-containing protein